MALYPVLLGNKHILLQQHHLPCLDEIASSEAVEVDAGCEV